jgi:hypothetical protein
MQINLIIKFIKHFYFNNIKLSYEINNLLTYNLKLKDFYLK